MFQYDPPKDPLVQIRDSDAHIVGEVADARFQAVTDDPLVRIPHHGRLQSFGGVRQFGHEYPPIQVYPQLDAQYDQD